MQRLHQLTPKLAGFAQSFTLAEDQELPTVAYAHVLGLRLCCLIFTAGHTRRARDISVLINEVQKLIIAIDRFLCNDFGFAVAGFGFSANVTVLVEKIEVLGVIALQPELVDLFRHAALDGPSPPPDAS